MNCPQCLGDTKVTDSRDANLGVRRRRECLECAHRFSTYEIESSDLEEIKELILSVKLLEPLKRSLADASSALTAFCEPLRTKRCSKCGNTKPKTDFHLHKGSNDGLNSYCKVCKNDMDRHRKR